MKGHFVVLFGFFLLASCTSAPRYRRDPPSGTPAHAGAEWKIIVHTAASYLGTPYRKGGTTRKGVDCSGLTTSVYRAVGIQLPRTAHEQSRVGKKIPKSKMKPGDLVFFATSGSGISHVGIYVGGGRFIHASTRAKVVRIDSLSKRYFRKRFVEARRVIGG